MRHYNRKGQPKCRLRSTSTLSTCPARKKDLWPVDPQRALLPRAVARRRGHDLTWTHSEWRSQSCYWCCNRCSRSTGEPLRVLLSPGRTLSRNCGHPGMKGAPGAHKFRTRTTRRGGAASAFDCVACEPDPRTRLRVTLEELRPGLEATKDVDQLVVRPSVRCAAPPHRVTPRNTGPDWNTSFDI